MKHTTTLLVALAILAWAPPGCEDVIPTSTSTTVTSGATTYNITINDGGP